MLIERKMSTCKIKLKVVDKGNGEKACAWDEKGNE